MRRRLHAGVDHPWPRRSGTSRFRVYPVATRRAHSHCYVMRSCCGCVSRSIATIRTWQLRCICSADQSQAVVVRWNKLPPRWPSASCCVLCDTRADHVMVRSPLLCGALPPPLWSAPIRSIPGGCRPVEQLATEMAFRIVLRDTRGDHVSAWRGPHPSVDCYVKTCELNCSPSFNCHRWWRWLAAAVTPSSQRCPPQSVCGFWCHINHISGATCLVGSPCTRGSFLQIVCG